MVPVKRKEHNMFVRCQRREYLKRLKWALVNSLRLSSFPIYGAHQSALGLPHFIAETNDVYGHSLKVKHKRVPEHRITNKLVLFNLT